MSKERPWEDLPDLFRMIDQMRSDGLSEDEIVAYLKHLDTEAFFNADLDMETAGVPEDVRKELWIQLDHFGDIEPADAEGD